uniref:Rhodanese domain-containing protein n=1 Tax=uncultured bacterium lac111 TaxID=1447235 RepID=X2LJI2_9BACT|nr:rhodanese domain-containing protein [uncultured bacterium lac111]
MRTILLAAVLAVGVGAGCSKSNDDTKVAAKKSNLPTITVDEVDQKLASGDCVPVDANGQETRKKMGIVPGAVLLTDSETFNVSELPADKSKTLVFYCANTRCGASHTAAEKALTAGYSNVKVMPDGIAGWVKAGKKIQSI